MFPQGRYTGDYAAGWRWLTGENRPPPHPAAKGPHAGRAMSNIWQSHHLVRDRDIKLGGKVFKQRQCSRCRRNFVIPPDSTEWAVVHVGIFKFDLLDGETSQRWLSQKCPGEHE
jgi:hypothetical protein